MPPPDLERIAAAFREHAGVAAKAPLALVTEVLGPTDWTSGPGDDAAALADGGGHLLAAGEALWPPFVAADPHGAGIGAVIANCNDIAAMGGRCLGIVDTVVGPEAVARAALAGLRQAAQAYGVPVLGGHLTVRDGPPALSAFAVGRADTLLASRNAAPGQVLLSAACLDGRLRGDFPFFSSFERRGARVARDLDVLARLAEAGDAVAARDVSMAGLLGSLAMLLEPTGTGVSVALDALPLPPGVALETWLEVFPSYGFLLCAPPGRVDACVAAFAERGLACAAVGVLDDSARLRVAAGGRERLVTDLDERSVTRLGRPHR